MGFFDRLREEFSPRAMLARAARKEALDSVRVDLEIWADYGDPALLESAIETLRRA